MSLKGKKQSPEHIAKRTLALTGRKKTYKNKETKARAISNLVRGYWLGKKMSDNDRKNMSLAHIGNTLSEEARRKISIANSGKKSHLWRGDKAGLVGMHLWVKKHKGKATEYKCKCGKQARHWANKKHDYKRNLDDYFPLCVSCHKKYDFENNLKPDNKIGSNQFVKNRIEFKNNFKI